MRFLKWHNSWWSAYTHTHTRALITWMQGCVLRKCLQLEHGATQQLFLRWFLLELKSRGGKIWIRWMSQGLAWRLLILLLQDWSRAHLETPTPPLLFFLLLLFDTSLKAFKRLSRTQFGTLGAELMGRDAISWINLFQYATYFPSSGSHWLDLCVEGEDASLLWLKIICLSRLLEGTDVRLC